MMLEKTDHFEKDNVKIGCQMFYSIFLYPYVIALVNFPLKRFRIFMLTEKYLLFEIYLLLSLISHWITMKLCQKPNHMIDFQILNMNNSRAPYCTGITDKSRKAEKLFQLCPPMLMTINEVPNSSCLANLTGQLYRPSACY